MYRGKCYLLVFTFCFINSFVSFGQSVPDATDVPGGVWDAQTLLTEVFDSNTVRALSESGILQDYSADVFDEYNTLFKEEMKEEFKIGKGKIKIPIPELYGSWNSKFVRNRIENNEQWVNLSYMNFGATANVFNLPLDISIQGAFLNNEFNWNLSGLNVSFDQRAFLENMAKEKMERIKPELPENPFDAVKQADIKKIFSEWSPNPEIPNNPFDSKSVDVLRNELKYKLLAFVINHPKYQEIVSKGLSKKDSLVSDASKKYITKGDSLSTKYDSIKVATLERKDSLGNEYKRYRGEAEKIAAKIKKRDKGDLKNKAKEQLSSTAIYSELNKISGEYRSSWEERKKYYGDTLQSVRQKLLAGTIKKDFKSMGKDSLLSFINEGRETPVVQKVFQQLEKLNIGRTVIDDHWFLAENLSLNGALMKYNSGSYTFSGAVGAQRFDYSILPLLGFSVPRQLPDKKFLYGSITYKLEELFELKISTLNSRENFNDFSTGLPLERENNVFLISGKTRVVKGLNLITGLAYSRTNGIVIQIPELEKTTNINKAAGEMKLEYQIPKTSFRVNAGYFFIGPQFLTLGNPFIRADQKGLTFGLFGNLFNRVNIDITGRQGRAVVSTTATPGRTDFSVNGSASINLTKSLTFSAAVYPNFTNYQYNQLFSVQSNLWSTSYDLQHMIQGEKIKLIQNLTYSNSINEFILKDSTGASNFEGLIYFGNLAFDNGMGFDLLAMGWSDAGLIDNGIDYSNLQLSYLFQKEKFGFRVGCLVGEQTQKKIENKEELIYGISMGANVLLFDKINIGLDSRLPLGKNPDMDEPQLLQEYISTKMSFKF